MSVVECDVPPTSMPSRELTENAWFHDCWRAPLTLPDLGIVAVFGHTPR